MDVPRINTSALSREIRITVYNAIVLPHFNYVSIVLFSLNPNNLEQLQIMRNRAIRVIRIK